MARDKRGIIRTGDFQDTYSNIKGEWSPVLSYRAVAGFFFLFPDDQDHPINLQIPAKETVEHGGSGEETFTLSHRMVESDGLTDDQTVMATKGDVIGINYSDDQITIDHDTEEDIDVYYLVGEGTARIAYVPPISVGNASKVVLQKSFTSLNSVNQFDTESQITLTRPAIVPEKHHLQLQVKSDADIVFPDNGQVGEIVLPYKARRREDMPVGSDRRVIEQITN